MIWICFTICSILSFLNFYKDKRIYSPSGVFAGFWATLLLLAGCRLYDLYETSDIACIFITIGVTFFCLGTNFIKMIKFSDKNYESSINEVIYNTLVIICLISLIYNIKVICTFVVDGFDFNNIYNEMARNVNGEDTEISSLNSKWQEQLQQYVGYPILYTLVPVSIAAFVKQHKKKYLIVAIMLSLIRFLVDIRRTFLVIMIVYVLTLGIIQIKNSSKSLVWVKKNRKKIFYFGIFSIILFINISTMRVGDENKYSFWKNIYMYYAGSLPYFSERLSLLRISKYTYGFTSFRGLIAPIVAFFELIGFSEPELMTLATENIQTLHNVVLYISPTHLFNSYATCFFEFFLDGGILGIILFSFAFGCFSFYLYKRAIKYKTMRDEFKYAYFFSLFIMLATLHFNGVVVCYIWPFIIEKILFLKHRIPKHKE